MKVFEFCYCHNTWESSPATISIHFSKEGAESAMNFHKAEERKKWQKLVDLDDEIDPELRYEILCPFEQDRSWFINEVEIFP